jgi:DNA-directed RNA polymerase subunit RPC12/RpoP
MNIFYITCPRCSREYYGDVSLLSLEVELHCPFCGFYFKPDEATKIATADRKVSPIVQLSKDKSFYKPPNKNR